VVATKAFVAEVRAQIFHGRIGFLRRKCLFNDFFSQMSGCKHVAKASTERSGKREAIIAGTCWLKGVFCACTRSQEVLALWLFGFSLLIFKPEKKLAFALAFLKSFFLVFKACF